MSQGYRAVGWNRQKRIYDLTLAGGIVLYLGAFVGLGAIVRPNATAEILLIRAFGTCALLLLHLVLSIGPLCRIDRRFLPLLYNRRHLGVTLFFVALAHGGLALFQFHALGQLNPLVSVLTSSGRYDSLAWFPFQPLGLLALVILFLMAATSHDFWLTNLTAPVWKSLHMAVYLAYGLVVLHVALGVLQVETAPLPAILLGLGLLWIVGLHLWAARRELVFDRESTLDPATDWVPVCRVHEIPEGRAKIVSLAGERVAVFRYEGRISALSNVCQHQNGPLGEGRVVGKCVVCPWHGYEYDPATGASPPPFTEKVPTFRVQVEDDRVFVDPRPLPAGTRVEPAVAATDATSDAADDLYIGYRPESSPATARFTRRIVVALILAAVGLATLLARLQSPFDEGTFEFGKVKSFHGILEAGPYPSLRQASGEVLHLVAPGKHGAEPMVEPFLGHEVELDGTLIFNRDRTMIELVPASVRRIDETGGPELEVPGVEDLGVRTLRGEIVDSKCYLGVMKPGRRKTHRACAALCIRGGIPPLFVIQDEAGAREHFFLVDDRGEPVNDRVLDMVAEPIEITGSILRRGDLPLLAADPGTYRRVDPPAVPGEAP